MNASASRSIARVPPVQNMVMLVVALVSFGSACAHPPAVVPTSTQRSPANAESMLSSESPLGLPYVDCTGMACIDTQTVLPVGACARAQLRTTRYRAGWHSRVFAMRVLPKEANELSLYAVVTSVHDPTFEQEVARFYQLGNLQLMQSIPLRTPRRRPPEHYVAVELAGEMERRSNQSARLWLRAVTDDLWTPSYIPSDTTDSCRIREVDLSSDEENWSWVGNLRAGGDLFELDCAANPGASCAGPIGEHGCSSRGVLEPSAGTLFGPSLHTFEWQNSTNRSSMRTRQQAAYEATVSMTTTVHGDSTRRFAGTTAFEMKIGSTAQSPFGREMGAAFPSFAPHSSGLVHWPESNEMMVSGCWSEEFDPASTCMYQLFGERFSVFVVSPRNAFHCHYDVHRSTAVGTRLIDARCWSMRMNELVAEYRVEIVACD